MHDAAFALAKCGVFCYYVGSGETRKLPLGGRATSNVTLQGERVEASTTRYPKKVGVNEDGSDRYESTVKPVPAHCKIKSSTPCPSWVK